MKTQNKHRTCRLHLYFLEVVVVCKNNNNSELFFTIYIEIINCLKVILMN